jgi:hypothetical protein
MGGEDYPFFTLDFALHYPPMRSPLNFRGRENKQGMTGKKMGAPRRPMAQRRGAMSVLKGAVGVCLWLLVGVVPAFAADASICSQGLVISLYDSGNLKSCNLRENYDINNVTCLDDNEIVFYDTGELQSCILSHEVEIKGVTCQQEGGITFYRDGNLASCVKVSQ